MIGIGNMNFVFKRKDGTFRHLRIDTTREVFTVIDNDREYNAEIEVKRISELDELIEKLRKFSFYREEVCN